MDFTDINVFAEVISDVEDARIKLSNRIFAMTERGDDNIDLKFIKNQMEETERLATRGLQTAMKRHPLGEWVRLQRGIGEKQAGRLLSVIGDPYIKGAQKEDGEIVEEARPRLVSELWAYSGMHVVDGEAPRHQRGVQGNWNDTARMRIRLISESCIRTMGGYYRRVYDDARTKYADSVHARDCKRCGPSGRPALVGSPLSDGHRHARALRIVSKEILKDMWLESRRIHENGEEPKLRLVA